MKYALILLNMCGLLITTITAMDCAHQRIQKYIHDQDRESISQDLTMRSARSIPTGGRALQVKRGSAGCFSRCFLRSSSDVSSSSEQGSSCICAIERQPLSAETKRLFWAVLNNNRDHVKHYMRHGADVNAKDSQGWAVLHYAAQGIKFECVTILLSSPVINRDLKTDSGLTAINILELMKGQVTVRKAYACQYLINQISIDPNFVDSLLDCASSISE